MQRFWKLLGAFWGDDEVGEPGDVPTLQEDGTVQWTPGSAGGYWAAVANGDPENPAYLFAGGDGVESFVVDA